MLFSAREVADLCNGLSDEKKKEFLIRYQFLAGSMLSTSVDIGVDALESVKFKFYGDEDDEEQIATTCEWCLNAYSAVLGADEFWYSLPKAAGMAGDKDKRKVAMEDLALHFLDEDGIEGIVGEELEDDGVGDEVEAGGEDGVEGGSEVSTEEMEGSEEEPVEEVKEEPEEVVEPGSFSDEDILRGFETEINSNKNQLLNRYDILFESGYDLSRPYGILSEAGVLTLKGENLEMRNAIGKDLSRSSSVKLYSFLRDKLNFVEMPDRSVNVIPQKIYEGYVSGSKPTLYFPYKLLELVYGRNPSYAKSEEVSTRYYYADNSNDWSKYRKSIDSFIKKLLVMSVGRFLKANNVTKIDNVEIIDAVSAYLGYTVKCLSTCVLLVDYSAVDGKPVKFKLRVCDSGSMLSPDEDLTEQIIRISFAGDGGGSDSLTTGSGLNRQVADKLRIYEYAHEFNFKLGNAMPLFAYKAAETLKERGINVSWKNLILGQSDDGTILKNGDKLDLTKAVFHFINAGSRAGKGVMTLNILAGGLASGKIPFYLDNKPDMASVLSKLAHGGAPAGNANGPEAFVVNGGNYEDDPYNEFVSRDSWIQPGLIPPEAKVLWGEPTWNNYGALFYMRALTLVLGILFARGREEHGKRGDPMFGGNNGLLIVVDEVSKFQREFISKLIPVCDAIPPVQTLYDAKVKQLEMNYESIAGEGKVSKADRVAFMKTKIDFQSGFNCLKFYALSYLKSLADSAEYIDGKNLAGFSEQEVGMSDVVVIGQDLEEIPINSKGLLSATSASRMKNDLTSGLGKSEIAMALKRDMSVPFSMFQFRYADAFIGYNSGHPEYLAQGDVASKANSRLNMVANKFCYIPHFTVYKDGRVLSRQLLGVQTANSESNVYFKPYLILNDATEKYTSPMFKRVRDAGLSEAQIIATYPDDINPSELSKNVGFPNYVQTLGMDNLPETLRSGAELSNHVLSKYIKYPGVPGSRFPLWLQFITDLRPEWMFSLKDIAEICCIGKGNLTEGDKNPLIREYNEYLKFVRNHSEYDIYDPILAEQPVNAGEFSTWDFNDPSEEDKESLETVRMGEAMGDYEVERTEAVPMDKAMNLFEADEVAEEEEKKGTTAFDTEAAEWNPVGGYTDDEEIDEIIKAVNEKVKNGEKEEDAWSVPEAENGVGATENPVEMGDGVRLEVDRDNGGYTANSYAGLVESVTQGMLKAYGGAERITSIVIRGGSLYINNTRYLCKLKESTKRFLPYDIREQLSSGQLANMIDYRFMLECKNLVTLKIESYTFLCETIAPALMLDDDFNAGAFFRYYRRLSVLVIGDETFTKGNYKEKLKTSATYSPSRVCGYASACHDFAKKANLWCWGLTTSLAQNRNVPWVLRALGTLVGAGASAVTLAARAGTKAVDKGAEVADVHHGTKAISKAKGGLGALISGVKDLWNE